MSLNGPCWPVLVLAALLAVANGASSSGDEAKGHIFNTDAASGPSAEPASGDPDADSVPVWTWPRLVRQPEPPGLGPSLMVAATPGSASVLGHQGPATGSEHGAPVAVQTASDIFGVAMANCGGLQQWKPARGRADCFVDLEVVWHRYCRPATEALSPTLSSAAEAAGVPRSEVRLQLGFRLQTDWSGLGRGGESVTAAAATLRAIMPVMLVR